MNETEGYKSQYCGQSLDEFHSVYLGIHGYVSLIVCIFGCIANCLNIIVLTRREMRSPTNAILTGLAIADLLVMLDYIPYSLIEYILKSKYPREIQFAYSWTWCIMFHAIFAQICHTISIWLTVTLAVWRFIAVAYPQRNRIWCEMRTTKFAIASSYIVCPLLAIPFYLGYTITPQIELLGTDGNIFIENSSDIQRNVTLYKVLPSELVKDHHVWLYSVVIKLIPCFALTILSLRLIGALLEAKRRRKQLINSSNTGLKVMSNGKIVEVKKCSKTLDKEKQTDRTTRMLLAVLLLFLLTEFPQGILGLMSALIGHQFFMSCYIKLGDLMDILALINSAINFILYCSMSRQFRSTFTLLFRPKCFDRWIPVPVDGDDDNQNGRTDGGGKDNNGHTTTQITQV